jgi:glycogen phosphorylase
VIERIAKSQVASPPIRCSFWPGYEPGVFAPIHDALLAHGDHYMHLADLKSYAEADQRLCELYLHRDG